MIVMVAIDEKKGMMFNHRRQSQDRILRKRVVELSKESRLWMNAYSYKQFAELKGAHLQVAEDYPEKATEGEYCFVEDKHIATYENRIERLILFKWNRTYPADMYLDIDVDKGGWKLVSTEDFVGYSHEKITQEVWER